MLHSRVPVFPPIDHTTNVHETIEFHWKHNAELPVFAFNEDGSSDVTEISFLEFGRAVHRAAHVLRPNRQGNDGEVVAFIALSDVVVYQAVFIGLMKAGLVPFPISPRCTPAAIVHMMKKTNSHRLVTTQVTLRELVSGVKAEFAANATGSLEIDEVPTLSELYPYLGKEAAEDPFEEYPPPAVRPPITSLAAYLHSSGSTGMPKPIPETYEMFVAWATFLEKWRYHNPPLRMGAMHLPCFHTLGVYIQVLTSLYACVAIGVYPPTAKSPSLLPISPSPDNVLDHTIRTKCNSLMTIPTLLQIWAQNQNHVAILKDLLFVTWSGGSVAPKLGSFMIQNGVKLFPTYGGTEFGAPSIFEPREDPNDWAYVEFNDRVKIRWEDQRDGTYECQMLTTDAHPLPIENLPDVRGYATSDLWEKHPTKENLWRIVGRVDDVIVHASGEKTVPGPMEETIMSSPIANGAVMFGREHNQTGILIEPSASHAIDVDNLEQVIDLRNKLWPIMEEANKSASNYSRIFKEMIIFTRKDKPLPRAGKGTVMRKLALTIYNEEIEALYSTVESTARGELVEPPITWSESETMSWLSAQVQEINSNRPVPLSDDLFEHGFDSLSAVILRRRIHGALMATEDNSAKRAADLITQTTVYNYPSIAKLSQFLVGVVADPDNPLVGRTAEEAIEFMISKYSAGLDEPVEQDNPQPNRNVILITGSTGNLGAQFLELALQDDRVERVYALNRPLASQSMLQRHTIRFEDKALDVSLLSSTKLVFIEGDTGKDNLGLSPDVYNELRVLITTIVHAAWRLDFNLSLASFELNIRGTRNLVDLARLSPHAPNVKFIFTSSVASALSWDQSQGPYPEEILENVSYAVGTGYGEGKYVAERILAKSGLQATSLRVGQVSGGAPNGAWATSDWVPILVKSGLTMGSLPSTIGTVSWLPMDAIANVILDVTFSSQVHKALNVVHPRPIEWNNVMHVISETLAQELKLKGPLPLVPFKTWLSTLDDNARNLSLEEQKNIPAIKILDFFQIFRQDTAVNETDTEPDAGGMSKFSTIKSQSVSHTLETVAPLGPRDAAHWVAYWNKAGLFEKL